MSSDNIGLGFYDENGITFQTEGKHIIENVKRILTTRRGERIGNLSFGSDVSKYLFMPDLTIDDLIAEIVNSIKRCEPRVTVEDVARCFGLEIVPIVLYGTITDAINYVKRYPTSTIGGKTFMEGVVGRPKVEMRDRCGKRLIVKIKACDFVED